MFASTDTPDSLWYVVESDNKKGAHSNSIAHLLSLIPYRSVPHEHVAVPPRQARVYERPSQALQTMVPLRFEVE